MDPKCEGKSRTLIGSLLHLPLGKPSHAGCYSATAVSRTGEGWPCWIFDV